MNSKNKINYLDKLGYIIKLQRTWKIYSKKIKNDAACSILNVNKNNTKEKAITGKVRQATKTIKNNNKNIDPTALAKIKRNKYLGEKY